ncbi:uncharacterized protein LOC113360648 [Papaver somniferum]|uniref:uncharacterized protein LOC113360648 n=1 Tax=Papaver somniferum TaxID=3469 RepID=UPI000E704E1F|nr:uncharacterized protein LOC113360648 [Papaver somniferum]
MVTSSSSGYDYYYSSSSLEEDSKTFVAKSRAKTDHVKEMKHNMFLNDHKVTRDELLKRKAEDETLANYRQRRDRFQCRKLAAEEKLRSHADGVASDSDASEDEPVDPDERPDFFNDPSDSEEELDKDSSKDNNDEESDYSDKSDDYDESDASDD